MSTRTVSTFFALLTVAANVAVLGVVAAAVAARFSKRARDAVTGWRAAIRPALLPVAWLVATVATLGSLYYSEVAHFVPCKLCWYQRIAMYPLAIILGIAAWRGEEAVRRYVLPVVTIGALISIYHYQLERFPSQSSFSCTVEAPCTLVWVWHFHYISIPFMALSAFALIATVLSLAREEES